MASNSHTVRLIWKNGNVDTINVPSGITILEAAISAGCIVPFECRWGSCAKCTGHLIKGNIIHTSPPRVLRKEHLIKNYVLLCVAEPTSDCSIEIGSHLKDSLSAISKNLPHTISSTSSTSSAFGWKSQRKNS